jgi:hypothetical protein
MTRLVQIADSNFKLKIPEALAQVVDPNGDGIITREELAAPEVKMSHLRALGSAVANADQVRGTLKGLAILPLFGYGLPFVGGGVMLSGAAAVLGVLAVALGVTGLAVSAITGAQRADQAQRIIGQAEQPHIHIQIDE